jgi:hypothetical protein
VGGGVIGVTPPPKFIRKQMEQVDNSFMRNFPGHIVVLTIFSRALSPLARAGEESKTAATVLTNVLKQLSI